MHPPVQLLLIACTQLNNCLETPLLGSITVGRVLIALFNNCVRVKSAQIANPIIAMNDPVPYCSIRARARLRLRSRESINVEKLAIRN